MGKAEAALLEKVNAEVKDLNHLVATAGKDDPLWKNLVEQMTEALLPFKEQDANAGDTQ
jgi:hypothetical protein